MPWNCPIRTQPSHSNRKHYEHSLPEQWPPAQGSAAFCNDADSTQCLHTRPSAQSLALDSLAHPRCGCVGGCVRETGAAPIGAFSRTKPPLPPAPKDRQKGIWLHPLLKAEGEGRLIGVVKRVRFYGLSWLVEQRTHPSSTSYTHLPPPPYFQRAGTPLRLHPTGCRSTQQSGNELTVQDTGIHSWTQASRVLTEGWCQETILHASQFSFLSSPPDSTPNFYTSEIKLKKTLKAAMKG